LTGRWPSTLRADEDRTNAADEVVVVVPAGCRDHLCRGAADARIVARSRRVRLTCCAFDALWGGAEDRRPPHYVSSRCVDITSSDSGGYHDGGERCRAHAGNPGRAGRRGRSRCAPAGRRRRCGRRAAVGASGHAPAMISSNSARRRSSSAHTRSMNSSRFVAAGAAADPYAVPIATSVRRRWPAVGRCRS
jgi:hypothetical protein